MTAPINDRRSGLLSWLAHFYPDAVEHYWRDNPGPDATGDELLDEITETLDGHVIGPLKTVAQLILILGWLAHVQPAVGRSCLDWLRQENQS